MAFQNFDITIAEFRSDPHGFTQFVPVLGDVDPDPALMTANAGLVTAFVEAAFYNAGGLELWVETGLPGTDSGATVDETTFEILRVYHSGGTTDLLWKDISLGGDLSISGSSFGPDASSIWFPSSGKVDNLWGAGDIGEMFFMGFNEETPSMSITSFIVTVANFSGDQTGFTFIGGPEGDTDPNPALIPGEGGVLQTQIIEITFHPGANLQIELDSTNGDAGVDVQATTWDHLTFQYAGGSVEFSMKDIGDGGDLKHSFCIFGVDIAFLWFESAKVEDLWTVADVGSDFMVGFDTEPSSPDGVTEWMRPTTVESRDIDSGTDWDDIENVLSGDSSVASVTLAAGETSNALVVQGFDMSSIPIGAVIVGVEAEFVEFTESSGAPGAVWDEVNLVLADDTLGTGDQSGDLAQIDNTVQTSVAGAPLSKWAENQITAAEARDPDFGIAVRILLVSGGTKADLRALRLRFFFEMTGPTVRKRPQHLGFVYG